MSAYADISRALDYDAAESMLAHGAPLATVLAMLSVEIYGPDVEHDESPVSSSPTIPVEK